MEEIGRRLDGDQTQPIRIANAGLHRFDQRHGNALHRKVSGIVHRAHGAIDANRSIERSHESRRCSRLEIVHTEPLTRPLHEPPAKPSERRPS